jgi:hypothetical protein
MILSKGRYLAITVCFFILFCLNWNAIFAQTSEPDKSWNFLAEPYLMFPYMDGETGIGNNLILPVDANPGDVFSKLQMGAMLYLEAQTDKWSITSDLVYMNLNQELTPGILIHEGDVTAKQLIWEIAGLYRLTSCLDVGVGGRVNYLQTSVDGWVNVLPAGIEPISGRQHKTWFDPILIARFKTDVKDKWLFQLRGDLGGFGVGSDLTWQLQGYVGYRFTKLFQLSAGYRILSTDYYAGEAPKDFVFDVNEFGPVLRFGFSF